jgi:RNA-directed DNA polymerase
MSSNPPDIWERIRRASREEVILEEMIRYGFWPAKGTIPQDPGDDIRRRTEIQKELAELRARTRKLYDEAALIKEMRKRRFAESRLRQQETKERHERIRIERAEAWRERKSREIGYLGAGVSKGLRNESCDDARLSKLALPRLGTAAEIASAMGIEVSELRFLAFSRRTSKTTHYVRFALPKKTGGVRMVSAPMPRLKAAQEWILRNILDLVPLHDASHGFRASRSIVTNAAPHAGADVVVNLDLEDFFPSISYKRIKGVFRALGYSEAAATIFGLICTESDVEEVMLDRERYFVATGVRRLPQGAPTSPSLTNILCRRLDKRLHAMALELGFAYTRYADDLTFSASGDNLANICTLLRRAESVVGHEGLKVNASKTRVLRGSRRQEVTGIVVNERLGVPRDVLRRFRATIYQIEKDGPVGKHWGTSGDVIASIIGFANFVYMVDPTKGEPLRRRTRAIAEKHGWSAPRIERRSKPVAPATTPSPQDAASPDSTSEPGDTSKKKWWKLW